jgi:hypothetical protein
MANLKGRVEALKGFEEKIRKKVLESREAQNAIKNQILPVVTEAINKGISDSQHHFKPYEVGGAELVGQLGVGSGGKPDREKLDKAWEAMQFVGNLGSSVSSIKLSLAKGSKFATFEFKISKKAFYEHFRTNYVSLSDGEATTVQWMKNFLVGIPTIDGYGFIGPNSAKFKIASSRTGLGHMTKVKIPSRQFQLEGYGEDKAFGAVIENVRKRLSSKAFADELAARLTKALRRKRNA